MARPSKNRFVCQMPGFSKFCSTDNPATSVALLLTVEEYEVLRLIDYTGCSQQDAANKMNISRSTLQALYAQARKKIARFLVEGTKLQIQGGNYELCAKASICNQGKKRKGDHIMKIAVTYENGEIFQHFGHTEQFKVYEVENGEITSTQIIDSNGQGHGALAGFLFGSNVDVLICGGIGGGARNALAEAGIELYPGASGDADAQVASFLQGKLQYDPDTMCNHHSHEEGHVCGDHGCGSNSCH